MKFTKLSSIPFLCFVCCLVLGCKQAGPADLPTLVPFTISVIQDEKPLEGATIIITPTDAAMQKWHARGETTASGTASLNTHGLYPGVAKGTFAVQIFKTETSEVNVPNDPASLEAIERGRLQIPEPQVFDLIDPQFNSPSTPLKLEVTGEKHEETFDVGKAVRIRH